MSFRKVISLAVYLIGLGFIGIKLVSCVKKAEDGMIIFTRVPIESFNIKDANIVYSYSKAQIVAINPDKLESSEMVLSSDFYSACSPDISYDAKKMLFIAQKSENDSWQVWEMDISKRSSKKITNFESSCYGPAYLPGDRLVFSQQMPNVGDGSVQALFTMNLDGTNLSQVTYHPHINYTSTILRDGRILMQSKQTYPSDGESMYLAMRPNGTKAELFYRGSEYINPQVQETEDGFIFFTEWKAGENQKRDIVSVHQNRPLYSRINYTENIPGNFYSVLPLEADRQLVSYRPSDLETVGLYYFSIDDKSLNKLYNNPDYHTLEPVLAKAFNRPRNLPDEVNPKETTGLLFCQDINVISQQYDSVSSTIANATKVEVLGIKNSLGIVPVEEDGSFYLKIIADTPFRLQTLDDNNQLVQGPSAWYWVRPFERRGCVGCHEDPELAPENFVPLSVKKAPVSVPVHNSPTP